MNEFKEFDKKIKAPGFIGDGSQLTIEGEEGNLKDALASKLNKIGSVWTKTIRFKFDNTVGTNSKTLEEIKHYSRNVETPALSGLLITLHIPFVANNTDGARSRILLYFDKDPISDVTKGVRQKWELHEVTLTGLVEKVTAATHKIRLYGAVNNGHLDIPHYDRKHIEHKIKPSIFANLNLIGFY